MHLTLDHDSLASALNGLDYTRSDMLKHFFGEIELSALVQRLWHSTNLRPIVSRNGILSHVKHGPDPEDHSARTDFFDYHCDGAYLERLPDICVLYCVQSGSFEIPTHFVDTRTVVKSILKRGVDPRALSLIEQSYKSRFGNLQHRKILGRHPRSGELVLHCSVGVGKLKCPKNRFGVSLDEEELTNLWLLIQEEIRSSPAVVEHWTKGKLVVWDNHTYLHGRLTNLTDLNRELVRLWLSLSSQFPKVSSRPIKDIDKAA